MSGNEWIYDWNRASAPLIPPGARILLNDETSARRPAKSLRSRPDASAKKSKSST